jgi:hypothetical protein
VSRVLAFLILTVAVAGCEHTRPEQERIGLDVTMWHDDERSVTCWIYETAYGDGFACLSDSDIATP